jgi:GNAT superfamily N-acetyltransferase
VSTGVDPEALAALCDAAMPEERLTADELSYLCFGDNDEVFGDERAAAVLQTQRFDQHVAAWLTLAVVHPEQQSRGRGKELVHTVAERAREVGARDLLLASAVPRYLWPGVDVANTRAGMLFEACGFERDWVGTNMAIDTGFRREPSDGVVVERETGAGAHAFAEATYPYWVPELDRAVGLGTAFAARDSEGRTIGFGCHSVNRFGWIGPMATEPTLQHGGVGSAVVAALCADLETRGCSTGEISWVSNLRFYGKCGARVSRVFLGGRKSLVPPASSE